MVKISHHLIIFLPRHLEVDPIELLTIGSPIAVLAGEIYSIRNLLPLAFSADGNSVADTIQFVSIRIGVE